MIGGCGLMQYLRRLAEQRQLDGVAIDLPKNVVLVGGNIAGYAPLSLGGELAELQRDLRVELFHDDFFEIRGEA